MKYVGSKNRIAKHILPIILKDRKEGQYYVEPFVGGANTIDKVDGLRIGSDINKQVISLLQELEQGWIPPKHLTEEIYNDMKENKHKFEDFMLGYAGFQLSYGAVYFCSYRRDNTGKRDYALEAYNNIVKQAPSLKGIKFLHLGYQELNIPDNSIIYCDIPYLSTDKGAYRGNKTPFNHNEFYKWCRDKSKEGHTVYVSEYKMPDDFICVWEKEISCTQSRNKKGSKPIEKLFTI